LDAEVKKWQRDLQREEMITKFICEDDRSRDTDLFKLTGNTVGWHMSLVLVSSLGCINFLTIFHFDHVLFHIVTIAITSKQKPRLRNSILLPSIFFFFLVNFSLFRRLHCYFPVIFILNQVLEQAGMIMALLFFINKGDALN
jgi:hypothetical protein